MIAYQCHGQTGNRNFKPADLIGHRGDIRACDTDRVRESGLSISPSITDPEMIVRAELFATRSDKQTKQTKARQDL
ncbi:MAG: hypothetical protein VX910_03255 [Candidatus Latescibacterota bacterium]|nr:hypothetical protein [Candidatus Latescibacterota bacterium]